MITSVARIATKANHKILSKWLKRTTSDDDATIPVTGVPDHWSSRACYLGPAGAHCWQNVETDAAYSGKRAHAKVASKINEWTRRHLNNGNVNTVVSFGPGVGTLDISVLAQLPAKGLKRFIPVDMNLYLMVLAAKNVDHADHLTSAPFSICGDFESGISEISRVLDRYISGSRLFLMLGGTFGNIEEKESVFLWALRNSMRPSDVFVLDTFIKGKDYTETADETGNLMRQPPSVQRFLRNGLTNDENTTGSTISQLITINTQVLSDIRGTGGFTFVTKAGQRPLLHVRRYEKLALANFLQQPSLYEILDSTVIETADKTVRRAVFFMKPN